MSFIKVNVYLKIKILVLAAWLKGRTNREKQVFSELFEQSFLAVFTWGTQNCEFMMEVLQCNIIQQMLFILEGLVPYSKEIEQAASMSIAGSNEGETNNFQHSLVLLHPFKFSSPYIIKIQLAIINRTGVIEPGRVSRRFLNLILIHMTQTVQICTKTLSPLKEMFFFMMLRIF